MLITIWGRDGSGKSSLADHLGSLLVRDSLAAVIDTDLTQPTLPVRLSGMNFKRERSLGRAIGHPRSVFGRTPE
jgi:MinD superfamily P-loop ATPase